MKVLVTGGSASGKSEYAENLAVLLAKKNGGSGGLLYAAAMKPYGEEAAGRIERHRKQREGKGFRTVEAYTDISGQIGKYLEKQRDGKKCGFPTVLLECLPNLLANELFDTDGGMRKNEEVFESLCADLCRLEDLSDGLIVVTSDTGSDGALYPPETEAYRRLLSRLSVWFAGRADAVIEVVYGVPVCLKGSSDHF